MPKSIHQTIQSALIKTGKFTAEAALATAGAIVDALLVDNHVNLNFGDEPNGRKSAK